MKLGYRCARCDEVDPLVLQVDHIAGNGKEDDEKFCNRSAPAYLKHVLTDQTDAYQLLCANCNIKKYFVEERERYELEGRWNRCNMHNRKK